MSTSTDTYPINPKLLAPVEPPRNPPVQIDDTFIMPREVASRIIVCNKISNKLRKRCRRAMQTVVVSRAPILQEMKATLVNRVVTESIDGNLSFVEGTLKLEKADRVYDMARVGKTVAQAMNRLVTRMSMKQLVQRARRMPVKRRQAQWVALNGVDEVTRSASEQRVNILDEMLDALETEIERRTKL